MHFIHLRAQDLVLIFCEACLPSLSVTHLRTHTHTLSSLSTDQLVPSDFFFSFEIFHEDIWDCVECEGRLFSMLVATGVSHMCKGGANKDIRCHISDLTSDQIILQTTSFVGVNVVILAVLRDNDLKFGRQMVYFFI